MLACAGMSFFYVYEKNSDYSVMAMCDERVSTKC